MRQRQCFTNARLEGDPYQPVGYASTFELEDVEAADEAKRLAYEAACVTMRDKDLAFNIHVESDEEKENETGNL